MSFRSRHLESMKEHRPDLYADLKACGELAAVEEEVQTSGIERLFLEADAREAELRKLNPDRSGYLIRVQALTEAESVVMREIVLVPPLDDETTTGLSCHGSPEGGRLL